MSIVAVAAFLAAVPDFDSFEQAVAKITARKSRLVKMIGKLFCKLFTLFFLFQNLVDARFVLPGWSCFRHIQSIALLCNRKPLGDPSRSVQLRYPLKIQHVWPPLHGYRLSDPRKALLGDRLQLAPDQYDRRSDENRGVGADHYAQQQREGEPMDHRPTQK